MTESIDFADMVAAVGQAKESRTRMELASPQYFNGTLHVTQKQWVALLQQRVEYPADMTAHRVGNIGRLGGIPVRILTPGDPVERPDGTSLMETLDGSLLILPKQEFTYRPEVFGITEGLPSVADAIRRITDVFLDGLEDSVHDASGAFLTFMESMPTRRHALYACLNKPWEADAWHWLRHAPTRRKIRRMRAQWESEDHARWARRIKKHSPITTEGMNS